MKLLRNQSGASAAEYALILGIVGVGIVLASLLLGDAVAGSINDAGSCISTQGARC